MEILTAKQMAEADRYTIEELGIPSIVLMENAARSISEEFFKLDLKKDRIAIVVGKGNNGGDGLAVARHLINNGFNVDVIFVYNPEGLKGDARINYEILKKYPVNLINFDSNFNFNSYDVIFDAIFGTGLNKPVQGTALEAIEKINHSDAFKIAIDIPSGLSGNSYQLIGKCVKADLTITLARPKIVHAFYPSKKLCGKVIVKDISIPDFAVLKTDPALELITIDNLPIIKRREKDSHKGHFGHNVIIGGSKGKMGAPIMASYASLMSGAGLTTCVVFEQYYYYLSNYPEVMGFVVENSEGYYNEKDSEAIIKFLEDKTVITTGCGIGREKSIKDFLRRIIEFTDIPIVIDADGILHLDEELLNNLRFRAVLTPHIGEFAKLTGLTTKEVLENRIELAKNFAKKYNLTLVLKSADTIIAAPEGKLFVVSNGVPALAKGGSGDCLAGIIGGLIAQGYPPIDASKLACFVMNKTAEILSHELNEKCIKTSLIIENLHRGFNEIEAKQQL